MVGGHPDSEAADGEPFIFEFQHEQLEERQFSLRKWGLIVF
jgi:hypothetical protein